MATTGPKTSHFRRPCRGRLLKLLIALAVIGLLAVSTVFTIKMHKKVKRLFHEMEGLQLSQAHTTQETQSHRHLISSLSREVEGLKSTIKAKQQNEEIIAVQLAELKATQALSKREMDRLTLVNKGYEVTLQELSDKYTRLIQANEQLTREVRLIEVRGSQVISEMKAELSKKLDSANFGEEVVKIVEEVLRQKLQEEFNRMFQERKELAHHKDELEGKVGFVKALDVQSALTKPFPEVVEKVNVEKKETINDDKSKDPFYMSDVSDRVSTSSEDEIMKKRQEAIDRRVAELIELFDKNFVGANDMSKENLKMSKEQEEKAKLLDPFYIEEVEVPIKPKVEAKKEKVPEVPNPNDPFYIEETSEKGVSYEEVRDKVKELADKTKKEFQAAENYVKEKLPIVSSKVKEIGKEIKEKTHKINKEVKHQVEKLAEKAKKATKTILSWFNR